MNKLTTLSFEWYLADHRANIDFSKNCFSASAFNVLNLSLDICLSHSQHDDRDEESECKWTDNRGRGRGSLTRGRARFLIRKATGGPNIIYPKWGLDKFQVNDEQGGMQREETEQDHKRAEVDGENI